MRVLIVDDGHYVVEYLKHLLDWKSFGIHQVETSTNSIEAWGLLDGNGIDLLITDIRMPEVSGIDLLEHIDRSKLKTKVIFLSGYSQFDYAQKAIRLGLLDYLLKPVDKDDMEKAVRHATESVREHERTRPLEWERFDGLRFLLSIVAESRSMAREDEPALRLLGEEPFCFFRLPEPSDMEEASVRDRLGKFDRFAWRTESALSGAMPHAAAEALAGRIGSLAFSEPFSFAHPHQVRHRFYSFFLQENVSFAEVERISKELPSIGEKEPQGKLWSKRYDQLDGAKQQKIYVMELIASLHAGSGPDRTADAAEWIFDLLPDPQLAFQAIVRDRSETEKSSRHCNANVVRMVRDYVDEHLACGLSLEELGEHVHLHPVYLSKLYKQETGQNLSAYIALRRLEKASRLLKESSLHVADISRMVGYKKPQYFIKLFKDEYGITPHQYRRLQLG
ncbi:DNA-binding response regulator, AraC family [Paenibacillus pasadenensis]|uniref:DNA-binding response regulator, AraC family n=1 Tax=Paenibacillus pasadenensis TaxID=217090 RepID=A0A2N5N2L3_9BACL|nr:response regulator [Paenibacillus pasadenensis]PLT44570.1 DNA-binding response regulator, AraC family [Paenibacillus pasadenensis]